MKNVDMENDRSILYKKVKTTPIRVKVTLVDGAQVEGCFHQPPSLRLTDMLNRHTQDNPFLAVTDAQVTLRDGQCLNYKFFTLNRSMVVCCFPLDEEVASL